MYSKLDWDTIREKTRNFVTNLLDNFPSCDVNDNYVKLKNHIYQAIEAHIPSKRVTTRFNIPWITTNIKHMGKNRGCTIGPKGPANHAIGRNSRRIRRTPSGYCAGRDGLILTRSLNSAYQRTIVNLLGNTLRPSDKTTLGSPHWKVRVSFSRTIWSRLRFSTI